MSQVNDYSIPGSPLTMAQLQVISQNISAALGSNNLGSSAPANPFDGMNWIDTSGAPDWSINVYSDGNGWRQMATINVATGALGLPGYVKQTAPTDATTDRLMLTGAFGIGSNNGAPLVQLNQSNPQGLYLYYSSDQGSPTNGSGSVLVLTNSDTGATNRQLAFVHSDERIFTRKVSGSQLDWTEWRELQTVSAGQISAFARSSAPTGWLKCNGAAVSRLAYSSLFAAIGTAFGAGDGSGTFNLPDLRGEFIRGWDDGRSVDSGRNFATSQSSQNLSHNHTPIFHGNGFALNIGGNQRRLPFSSDGIAVEINTTASGGAEARPRNVALLYCIKF